MTNDVLDYVSSLDPESFLDILFDSGFYEIIFPFLITFAFLYTILHYVSFLKSKTTGAPYKSAIMVIAGVVSWYGVSFEISEGYSLGKLMMMLFPNISALTIGILALYIVGGILGKNFLKGIFEKKSSAFLYLTIAGLGLTTVLYYTGIAMGFLDLEPGNGNDFWNFTIAAFLLILGVVFLFVDLVAVGAIFLFVFFAFVYNGGGGSIWEYFIDPVIFILTIFLILASSITSSGEKTDDLAKKLKRQEKSLERYKKSYGGKPADYESRFHDITDSAYNSNKEKYENLTGKKWQ